MKTTTELRQASEATGRRYRVSWIDGRDWEQNEGSLSAINPANGVPIGEVGIVGPEGVNAAVSSARHAFESWSRLPIAERKKILASFAQGIAKNVEELALLETLEVGRPIMDATALIGMAPDILHRYIGMIDHVQGDVINAEQRQLGLSWRRPRGVIGAILPWNFPVMNVLIRLAPALAAGNSVVVKPSENSPRSAVALAQIASQAGIPNGVFNVVLGTGAVAGQALASHPQVDLITFTGSTKTGLAISRSAAQSTLKPVLMECGGKSPQIVLDDAFTDPNIWHPIFFSSFWNSGQWCAAKTRLLVPRSRVSETISGLNEAAKAWRLGDPLKAETRLGPVVNSTQWERVNGYMEESGRLGSLLELDCPKKALHTEGYYITPSLALDQPRGSKVIREEVFGPLLTVEAYDDLDDAISLANDTDYGLMASIWTNHSDLGYRLARDIIAGGITINASAEAVAASTPDFVGAYLEPHKQSGHGLDGGQAGLMSYMTAQSVTWLT